MQETCSNCGNETFSAGEIELHPEGGYDINMICKECGTPNTILHEDDTELAQILGQFFAAPPAS